MIKQILLLLMCSLNIVSAMAQANTYPRIHGIVTDVETGEPIPYVNVFYDRKGVGTITDINGKYTLENRVSSGWSKLSFSSVGYTMQVANINASTRELNVKMRADLVLSEVIVKPKKEKYSRKNNPAVELMKKVVNARKANDLSEKDFYHYDKYRKLTLSLDNVMSNDTVMGNMFKKYPFLLKQVEVSDITGKKILPVSVEETASEILYRKNPQDMKTIIKGVNSSGVNELLNTGDMLNTMMADVFQDINIYQEKFRFLQYPFDSPVSKAGIGFYQYYIMDTVYVDTDKCFHLTFVPNNSQDFGFTGHLYVLSDSTYRVKKCVLNLPRKSDINFINNLIVTQEFGELPTGEWVLRSDDMMCEIAYLKSLNAVQVRRITKYNNFGFEPIPAKIFARKGKEIKDVNAMMRDDKFWEEYRPEKLTGAESRMNQFVSSLSQIKGFKYIIFVGKALIENFVETGTKDKPSKIDIGPINTIVSSNYIDGLRLRASAQTTANLHPNLFLKGYYAYGFKDKKFKYNAELEYSFKKKEYLPREYPIHSISASYMYDNMSPSDKFLATDKDNVFTSFKTVKVDQFNYARIAKLKYQWEQENGLKTTVTFAHSNYEATGRLFYRTLEGQQTFEKNFASLTPAQWERSPYDMRDYTTTEISLGIRYAPGETFINTKQRRVPINLDAPIFTLQHTMGMKALGADYAYHFTEASLYKRLWLGSWGSVDTQLKGGIQWSKVPFPLLIMPAANLSYILQDGSFNLINNMEFLNDKYASLDVEWNLQGKLLNRIPLLRKLKWREHLGVKMLWGTLSDKNNPFLAQNAGDKDLMMFPGHYNEAGVYEYSSYVMDKKRPYVEVSVGLHNIFKLLHVEYVRRLNYNELPTASKWGIRFMVRTVF